MSAKHTALAALTITAAAPALACGGPSFSSTELVMLMLGLGSAPLLAALTVDRGAFSIATHAMKMKRKHQPTAFGPLLTLIAIAVAFTGIGMGSESFAYMGLAIIPVATVVSGLSFVRSVIIEQRGHLLSQVLRVGAVALFAVLGVLPFIR